MLKGTWGDLGRVQGSDGAQWIYDIAPHLIMAEQARAAIIVLEEMMPLRSPAETPQMKLPFFVLNLAASSLLPPHFTPLLHL